MKKTIFLIFIAMSLVSVARAANPLIVVYGYGPFIASTWENIPDIATNNNDYEIRITLSDNEDYVTLSGYINLFPTDYIEVIETDDNFNFVNYCATWYGAAGGINYKASTKNVNLKILYIKDPSIRNRSNSPNIGWQLMTSYY